MFPETDYESQTVQLERDDSVNFSERWIQRIAELHGRLLWHGESARSMRVPAEKTPEEILHQMTEAVIRYSCDRPQQEMTGRRRFCATCRINLETTRAGIARTPK